MAQGSLRRLTIVLLGSLLAACAGFTAPGDREVAVGDVAPPERAPDPAPRRPAEDGAAAAPVGAAAWLLEDARGLAAAGDWERAAAQVERALRIDRGNPWLYLELARIRMAQGNLAQGELLLERARTLAAGDERVMARARALQDAARANADPP